MYYILYEGLKIESNEPVYCTVYTVYTVYSIQYTVYCIHYTVYTVHINYNTYLYFSIICINYFYNKIVTFGHEAFKV